MTTIAKFDSEPDTRLLREKCTAGHICATEKGVTEPHYAGAHEQYLTGLFREERSASAARAS